MPHTDYYIRNAAYSRLLDKSSINDKRKYIDSIIKVTPRKGKFVDVGCGTGQVVELITKQQREAYGVEISLTSFKIAKKRKGNFLLQKPADLLPFPTKSFHTVGCFNVLEHVDKPVFFLDEMYRLVKPNGYLIIGTPNFLSITNNYHYRTAGIDRKIKNLGIIIKKLWYNSWNEIVEIDKFPSIKRKVFQPDDDAVNLTNPFDILKWAKVHRMEVVVHSASVVYDDHVVKDFLANTWPFKLVLGSVFVILKKTSE